MKRKIVVATTLAIIIIIIFILLSKSQNSESNGVRVYPDVDMKSFKKADKKEEVEANIKNDKPDSKQPFLSKRELRDIDSAGPTNYIHMLKKKNDQYYYLDGKWLKRIIKGWIDLRLFLGTFKHYHISDFAVDEKDNIFILRADNDWGDDDPDNPTSQPRHSKYSVLIYNKQGKLMKKFLTTERSAQQIVVSNGNIYMSNNATNIKTGIYGNKNGKKEYTSESYVQLGKIYTYDYEGKILDKIVTEKRKLSEPYRSFFLIEGKVFLVFESKDGLEVKNQKSSLSFNLNFIGKKEKDRSISRGYLGSDKNGNFYFYASIPLPDNDTIYKISKRGKVLDRKIIQGFSKQNNRKTSVYINPLFIDENENVYYQRHYSYKKGRNLEYFSLSM